MEKSKMYNVENLPKIAKHAKKQKKTTHHEGKKIS